VNQISTQRNIRALALDGFGHGKFPSMDENLGKNILGNLHICYIRTLYKLF
jgi:hypothetical protein